MLPGLDCGCQSVSEELAGELPVGSGLASAATPGALHRSSLGTFAMLACASCAAAVVALGVWKLKEEARHIGVTVGTHVGSAWEPWGGRGAERQSPELP